MSDVHPELDDGRVHGPRVGVRDVFEGAEVLSAEAIQDPVLDELDDMGDVLRAHAVS